MVPDVEHAVVAEGEHQEAAVGRYAGQGDALAEAVGAEHQLAGPELVGVGVERLAVEVVLDLLGAHDDLGLVAYGVAELEVGTAVVDGLAVGGPAGEYLELRGVALDVGHLVPLHVVGNEIAGRVEHLDLVQVAGVEALARVVGRVDDEGQPGMPRRVDASRDDGVVLHVDLPQPAVVVDDGAALVLAGVELHALRVVLLVVVAVDALAVQLGAAEHVVDHHPLVVVLKAALVKRQLLVGDVAGRNQAVADVGVDAIVRHVDLERLVAAPLVAALGIDLDIDGSAGSLRRQLAPVVDVGLHLVAATYQLLVARLQARHNLVAATVPFESQRRNVHRHGDVAVVGIDGRSLPCLGKRLRHAGVPAPNQHPSRQYHHIHQLSSHLFMSFTAAKVQKKNLITAFFLNFDSNLFSTDCYLQETSYTPDTSYTC